MGGMSRIGNVKVPAAIEEIRTAPVVHDHVYDKTRMEQAVRDFLKL